MADDNRDSSRYRALTRLVGSDGKTHPYAWFVVLGLIDLLTVSRSFSDGQRRDGQAGGDLAPSPQYLGNFLLAKGKAKFLVCRKNTIVRSATRKSRSANVIATASFVLVWTMRAYARTGRIIAVTAARPAITWHKINRVILSGRFRS